MAKVKNAKTEELDEKEKKRKYAREYAQKKRDEKQKIQGENLQRKAKGEKTKKMVSLLNGGQDDEIEHSDKFSSIKESTRIIFNPLPKSHIYLFKCNGFKSYCELKSWVNITVTENQKSVVVDLSFWLLPPAGGSEAILAKKFDFIDFSSEIKSLNYGNYKAIFQDKIKEIVDDKINKWKLEDFMKTIISFSNLPNGETIEILWDCLDQEWCKKHNIGKQALYDIGNDVKQKGVKRYARL